jgi:hypothetical protein
VGDSIGILLAVHIQASLKIVLEHMGETATSFSKILDD